MKDKLPTCSLCIKCERETSLINFRFVYSCREIIETLTLLLSELRNAMIVHLLQTEKYELKPKISIKIWRDDKKHRVEIGSYRKIGSRRPFPTFQFHSGCYRRVRSMQTKREYRTNIANKVFIFLWITGCLQTVGFSGSQTILHSRWR